MIIVNTEYISGKEIETIELVEGSTIQSIATLNYDDGKDIAFGRMIEEAEYLGADGIVNVRFSTSNILTGLVEFMAYGTAVRFK